MFSVLEGYTPAIHTHADKIGWAEDMNSLIELRKTSNIGTILDHLMRTKRLKLPDTVERKQRKLAQPEQDLNADEVAGIERLRKLRAVSYQEVIALTRFINGHTPFSTKHGVKGAQFENVLVVVGRGWNQYEFNQMLEWAGSGVPAGKESTFERNRNLFYVSCSRPKKRLALLFTQQLSGLAMKTLVHWFGENSIHSIIST